MWDRYMPKCVRTHAKVLSQKGFQPWSISPFGIHGDPHWKHGLRAGTDQRQDVTLAYRDPHARAQHARPLGLGAGRFYHNDVSHSLAYGRQAG